MPKARSRPLAGIGALRLMASRRVRVVLAVLNILPLPGLGAIMVGWRNAHTTLRRNGAMQLTLVLFGSWPLIIPGAIGLVWAMYDAIRIAQAQTIRFPPANAVDPVASDT